MNKAVSSNAEPQNIHGVGDDVAPEFEWSLAEERKRRIDTKLRRELGRLICGFLTESDVVEVMLNPDGGLWVERLALGMERVGTMPAAQAESLMTTIASTLNTVITRANPIIECELPLDGSRFEGLIPPIVSAPVFAIRKKALKIFTLDDYVNGGMMTSSQLHLIQACVKSRKNILVVGGTGTGKTTLTNAIIDDIVKQTPEHRLVIIEDTAEIQCVSKNTVILRATDEVDMLRLLKATMRLRPDRILVGEVRGSEALALLKAWNTGHPGGVVTIHANNALAGLRRLEGLIAEATQSPMQALIGEAIDVVVSIKKTDVGRRIDDIIIVDGFDVNTGQYLINNQETRSISL